MSNTFCGACVRVVYSPETDTEVRAFYIQKAKTSFGFTPGKTDVADFVSFDHLILICLKCTWFLCYYLYRNSMRYKKGFLKAYVLA